MVLASKVLQAVVLSVASHFEEALLYDERTLSRIQLSTQVVFPHDDLIIVQFVL